VKWFHIALVIFRNVGRFFAARVRLLLYFFALICIIGNFGTLFSWGQWIFGKEHVTALDVLRNFGTYTIAIAVTSFADTMLRKADEDKRTWLLLLFIFMGISVIAGGVLLWVDSQPTLRSAAIVSATLAAWLWFCAHSRDPNLVDDTAYSALGKENPVQP
jgi:hypothetical protein